MISAIYSGSVQQEHTSAPSTISGQHELRAVRSACSTKSSSYNQLVLRVALSGTTFITINLGFKQRVLRAAYSTSNLVMSKFITVSP